MPEERIVLKGRTELLKPVITEILALYQLLESKDLGSIYGAPSIQFQAEREFKPQVGLFFLQDSDFVPTGTNDGIPKGRRRLRGEISFRVMSETSETISKNNGIVLGQKIKEVFGGPTGYVWKKGRTMCAYTDHERGYGLQLRCRSKAEGKELVAKILSIQGHTPEWNRFTINENDQPLVQYPDTPPTKTIMGETVQMPRKRPVVDVRFQYATMYVHGLSEPVPLYDRTGKLVKPLVI